MRSYYKFFLELDSEKEVEVKVYYIISNNGDGIGTYEFWGQKCYDRGTNSIQVESQEWNKSLYTQEENKEIESKITEEQIEKWTEEISDSFPEPDNEIEIEDEYYTFPDENEF